MDQWMEPLRAGMRTVSARLRPLGWKYPLLGGAGVLLALMGVIASCQPKPKPASPVSTRTEVPAPPRGAEVTPLPAEEVETNAMLSDEQWALLQANGWDQQAGAEMAAWVSVDEQVFRLVRGREILWEVPCSTAARGTGSVMNSLQTPLGWHLVKSKTGAEAPWGQVFRSGHATAEVWKPGQSTKEDLVLTRVLFLDGLEPGRNKGGNVDSYSRKIYIHGTNDEDRIGTPVSHGCVRLRNDDVIEAYLRIPEGTRVLITEHRPSTKTAPTTSPT